MKKSLAVTTLIALATCASFANGQPLQSLPNVLNAVSEQAYTAHANGVPSYCSINSNTESAYPDTLVRSIGKNFDHVMIHFDQRITTLAQDTSSKRFDNPNLMLWNDPAQKIILALEINQPGEGLLTIITPKVRESYVVTYNCLKP
ncbi:Hypothetical protein F387_01508 [Wohlfahrtiimonas chitiniclastica SH04]|uniref:Uncharacterized protein n=1 Tax=Wohlfahrtiimonas chitiniclastica SH04 TaxID=1261130 RepID=L8XY15_9GAMM|nr:hypothetical protein [Wohlfahrtiimonas chitiniclastica]ELV07704.1 Hypothetical protein F387_01508 [Wohlfahrtiimonas chitiniclastica SH04]